MGSGVSRLPSEDHGILAVKGNAANALQAEVPDPSALFLAVTTSSAFPSNSSMSSNNNDFGILQSHNHNHISGKKITSHTHRQRPQQSVSASGLQTVCPSVMVSPSTLRVQIACRYTNVTPMCSPSSLEQQATTLLTFPPMPPDDVVAVDVPDALLKGTVRKLSDGPRSRSGSGRASRGSSSGCGCDSIAVDDVGTSSKGDVLHLRHHSSNSSNSQRGLLQLRPVNTTTTVSEVSLAHSLEEYDGEVSGTTYGSSLTSAPRNHHHRTHHHHRPNHSSVSHSNSLRSAATVSHLGTPTSHPDPVLFELMSSWSTLPSLDARSTMDFLRGSMTHRDNLGDDVVDPTASIVASPMPTV
jgi:hypothetical protein